MKKFEMFIITHKKVFYKIIKNYVPIQVGNKEKIEESYLIDNVGDNISEKNANYCELTALYWLWKNYELPEYIGICHYRRFFVKRPIYNLVDEKFVDKELDKYDVILPYPYKPQISVKEHFINSKSGRKEDIDRLEKFIEKNYPLYYNDYTSIMNGKQMSYCNMAIMKKDDFKEYCDWLFNLLFEFEKGTDLTGYSKEESRIYGFLSEFLLNVWIKNKGLKIKYCNIICVNENKVEVLLKKIRFFFKDFIKVIKGEI